MEPMEQGIEKSTLRAGNPRSTRWCDRYHCVEFSIEGLECAHQFRLWNLEPTSAFVLVKQNSDLLTRLRVGDVMKMKYYTKDSLPKMEYMNTAISHITREDQGKFRGHCLIGLAAA
jgi:hypothetical protein